MHSQHFLRFILDSDNDIHFTPSLAPLESVPYIWYLLRQEGRAKNIVFVQARADGQLELQTFDADSRQYLQKTRGFSLVGWKDQTNLPVGSSVCLPSSLKLSEKELLHKLLDEAEEPTALVFSSDAFGRLCLQADRKSAGQVEGLLKNPGGRCRFFVRIPLTAEGMEQLVDFSRDDNSLLKAAFSEVRLVLDNKPEALLPALANQLSGKLIRLDDHAGEIFYMLQQRALMDADLQDSMEELGDQAAYLELCRVHRLRLLAPDSEAEQYTPVSLRLLWERLEDPGFRARLRRQTAELRQSHPSGTIRDALAAQTHLPMLPPQPMCHDDLAQRALGLAIPADWDCSGKASWSVRLDKIKRNLITLWNNPRNCTVMNFCMELCRSAREAIVGRNARSLEEILYQLEFFSGNLCPAPERMAVLEDIHTHGGLLIEFCDSLHSRIGMPDVQGLDAFAHKGVEAGEEAILKLLRQYVRGAIGYFGRPNLSVINLTKMIEEDWKRTQKEIEQCRATLEQRIEQQPEPVLKEEDDRFEDFVDSFESNVRTIDPESERTERIHFGTMEVTPIEPDQYWKDHFGNYSTPSARTGWEEQPDERTDRLHNSDSDEDFDRRIDFEDFM